MIPVHSSTLFQKTKKAKEIFRKNNQRLLPSEEIHFGDDQSPKLAPNEAARFGGIFPWLFSTGRWSLI